MLPLKEYPCFFQSKGVAGIRATWKKLNVDKTDCGSRMERSNGKDWRVLYQHSRSRECSYYLWHGLEIQGPKLLQHIHCWIVNSMELHQQRTWPAILYSLHCAWDSQTMKLSSIVYGEVRTKWEVMELTCFAPEHRVSTSCLLKHLKNHSHLVLTPKLFSSLSAELWAKHSFFFIDSFFFSKSSRFVCHKRSLFLFRHQTICIQREDTSVLVLIAFYGLPIWNLSSKVLLFTLPWDSLHGSKKFHPTQPF